MYSTFFSIKIQKVGEIMGNRLQELRKKYKITQQDLANNLGVSRQYISDIERHKLVPSLLMAFKISDFLNVPVYEIFYIL